MKSQRDVQTDNYACLESNKFSTPIHSSNYSTIMPPQITFISLTKEIAIPVKIFIKNIPSDPTSTAPPKPDRPSTTGSTTNSTTTSLSINEKSPITIHNINQIKLNNAQIEHLVTTISPRVKNLLYYNLHHNKQQLLNEEGYEVKSVNETLGETFATAGDYFKTTTLKIDNLKIVIPIDVLYQVRYQLGLIEYDEARKYLRDSGLNLVVVKRQQQQQRHKQAGGDGQEGNESGNVPVTTESTLDDDEIDKVQIKQEESNGINVSNANGYSGHVFNGKLIVGDFATCIKIYVY